MYDLEELILVILYWAHMGEICMWIFFPLRKHMVIGWVVIVG
jgi:hypothetical protein